MIVKAYINLEQTKNELYVYVLLLYKCNMSENIA